MSLSNIALEYLSLFMTSRQSAVPKQSPVVQPLKNEYWEAVGWRDTVEFAVNKAEQSVLQAIAEGVLTTVPEPLPVIARFMAKFSPFFVNVAIT